MKAFPVLLLAVWLVTSGSAKKLYLFNDKKVVWHKAYTNCQDIGLQLVTIQTAADHAQVEAALRNSTKRLSEFYWTSGNDLSEENKFVWMSTGRPFTFTKFMGAPIGQNTNYCVHTMQYGSEFRWRDNYCLEYMYYICEDKHYNCTNAA